MADKAGWPRALVTPERGAALPPGGRAAADAPLPAPPGWTPPPRTRQTAEGGSKRGKAARRPSTFQEAQEVRLHPGPFLH